MLRASIHSPFIFMKNLKYNALWHSGQDSYKRDWDFKYDINVTNLYLKTCYTFGYEKFEKQIINENSAASSYFLELLKESKELYKANSLTKLSLDCLKNFKYVYSILVLEFVKKNLINSKASNTSKNSSDNIIDVELADES
jgi:hypothetical protein